MSIAEQNQKIAEHIEEYGWHCLHILPTQEKNDHEQFSYSIGFSETYNAPEILVFGLSREKSHALLNECAQLLHDGHIFRADIPDGSVLSGSYKVVFKPVKKECFDQYLGTAVRYFGTKPFDAMVMFLPDKNNRFPWESSYCDVPTDESLSIV